MKIPNAQITIGKPTRGDDEEVVTIRLFIPDAAGRAEKNMTVRVEMELIEFSRGMFGLSCIPVSAEIRRGLRS